MDSHWHLGETDIFHGLLSEKESFLAHSVRRRVRAHDFLFLEGEPTISAFYLESGTVGIFRTNSWGKACIVFARRPGEMFGLAEIVGLDTRPRQANAQSLTSSTVYEISKGEFDLLLQRHPDLSLRVMDVLGRRLRFLCEQIENLMACDVTTRLLKTLVYLCYPHLIAGMDEGPVAIPVRLTQEQIASMIGSCQQTVSGILNRLEQDGLIKVTRKEISVLDPAAVLSRLAAEST